MVDIVKLKRGSVIMVETAVPLPDQLTGEISAKIKEYFPECEVFMPNGAKVTILESE